MAGIQGRWQGVTAAAVLALWLVAACTVPGAPLNSEMIADNFGSYHVEVLAQSSQTRVSSLYSGEGETKVTRTFAVVLFPDTIAQSLRIPHQRVLNGASLGATLVGQGWQLVKDNLGYDIVSATPRVSKLMRIDPHTPLAVHLYSLKVRQGAEILDYVHIAEVHHPQHLTENSLRRIYGPLAKSTSQSPSADPQRERLLNALNAVLQGQ